MKKFFAIFFLALIAIVPLLAIAQGALPAFDLQWAAALVFWPSSQAEYVFLICAWLGVAGHWANKRRLGEIHDSLRDYLLAESAGLSVATVLVIYAMTMLLLSAGIVAQAALPGAAIGGFGVGWMIDSVLQKRAR